MKGAEMGEGASGEGGRESQASGRCAQERTITNAWLVPGFPFLFSTLITLKDFEEVVTETGRLDLRGCGEWYRETGKGERWRCSHDKGTFLTSGRGQAETPQLLECSKGTAFRLHFQPDGFLASLESCASTHRNSALAEASGPFVPAGGHTCVCVHARMCPRQLGEPWSNRAWGFSWSAAGLPIRPAATLPPTQPPGCPQTQQGPAQWKVP